MRKWDSAGLVTYLVQASSCPQHRAFRNLIHSRELDGHASNPFETTSLKCKTLAVAKPMPLVPHLAMATLLSSFFDLLHFS
jgi:hypothetical protein